MLKLVNLDQNSIDWHLWRKGKIGSSTIASIMGVGYTTPYEAFLECLGFSEREVTPAMLYGKKQEEVARLAFEEWYGWIFNPSCAEHPENPKFIASLDGLSFDNTEILEIKTTTEENFQLAKKGVIPAIFSIQIQWQLFVTNLKKAWCWVWNGQNGIAVFVGRNEDLIEEIKTKAIEFLNFLERKEPPPLTEKDIIIRDDQPWKQLAKQYINVESQLKALEEEKLELRKQLESLSTGKNCLGGGIRIRHNFRKGNINFKKMCSTLGIDEDIYRNPPIKTFTIEVI